MKQTLILLIGIAMISILGCSSCKKNAVTVAPDNPYGLPNATQTGVGMFAYKLNGTNVITYYNLMGTKAEYTNGNLSIIGTLTTQNAFYILSVGLYNNINTNVKYQFDNINSASKYQTDSSCLGISNNLITTKTINGSVTLTRFDKTQKIVSGIF